MDLFMETRNPGRSITLINKKSRTLRISHKDEKQELTRETENEQSNKQEVKQKTILSSLPGKEGV